MKLTLRTDGVEQPIEIQAAAPSYRFRLGDAPERDANVEMPEPDVYSVLLDGRMYDARVEETPAGLVIVIDGYRFEIEVRDPRRWSRKDAARAGEGVQTVMAPMPGTSTSLTSLMRPLRSRRKDASRCSNNIEPLPRNGKKR